MDRVKVCKLVCILGPGSTGVALGDTHHRAIRSVTGGETDPVEERMEAVLLADAKLAEDEVDDVIVCGDASERVECVEGLVEVEQEHLMWEGSRYRMLCLSKRSKRNGHGLLLADVSEERGLRVGVADSDERQDGVAQFSDARACQGRGFDRCVGGFSCERRSGS
jgi:hypothetical protein